jgi:hypothetical protein
MTWLQSRIQKEGFEHPKKHNVTRDIENGKKKCKLTHVGNLILLILLSKRFGKAEPKLLLRLNTADRE